MFREVQPRERPDGEIRDVHLPRTQPMRGGMQIGVVVVVPTLAVGEHGDPPVVGGTFVGVEGFIAPEVRGRIDQPGGVVHKHRTHEQPPHQDRQSAEGIEQDT